MRRSARLLLAVAAASLAAAGASAFTNSNDDTSTTGVKIGFSSTSVAGVTLTDIHYTLSANGTTVTNTFVKVLGDTHTSTMAVGFNHQNMNACATGVYDGSTYTDYQCTASGTNASILTSAITSVEVVVH